MTYKASLSRLLTKITLGDPLRKTGGKIYYRGAEWKAVSLNHDEIVAGSKVVITRTDGIVLVVEVS